MENDNLDLWNRVQKTDPNHTKKAKVGGMSITSIAPQYQILNATREFGIYGRMWGFKEIELGYNLLEKYNVIVFKGTFFFPAGEFQIISSSKMFMDRKMEMVDADFAKKIETDALTKALSKLGFNADIFMGRYDDIKYFNEVTAEFKKKPSPTSKQWNQILEGKKTLDQCEEHFTLTQTEKDVLEKVGIVTDKLI